MTDITISFAAYIPKESNAIRMKYILDNRMKQESIIVAVQMNEEQIKEMEEMINETKSNNGTSTIHT